MCCVVNKPFRIFIYSDSPGKFGKISEEVKDLISFTGRFGSLLLPDLGVQIPDSFWLKVRDEFRKRIIPYSNLFSLTTPERPFTEVISRRPTISVQTIIKANFNYVLTRIGFFSLALPSQLKQAMTMPAALELWSKLALKCTKCDRYFLLGYENVCCMFCYRNQALSSSALFIFGCDSYI